MAPHILNVLHELLVLRVILLRLGHQRTELMLGYNLVEANFLELHAFGRRF